MKKGGCRVANAAWMVASVVVALASMAGSNMRPAMAQDAASGRQAARCQGDNGGLTLSPGFCASIFADNLGHVRHLVVASDGEVYANTWSGRYFPNSPPPPGGFLVTLRDTKGSGRADVIQRFGVTVEQGGTGGSGIALYNGGLYAEENHRILRYELIPGSLPGGTPRVVVSGLPLTGDHPMHPFVIDGKGSLFVDVGTATNACQEQNRIAGSRGIAPCTEKQTAEAPGGLTPTRPVKLFLHHSATRVGFVTARGSRLMPPAVCS